MNSFQQDLDWAMRRALIDQSRSNKILTESTLHESVKFIQEDATYEQLLNLTYNPKRDEKYLPREVLESIAYSIHRDLLKGPGKKVVEEAAPKTGRGQSTGSGKSGAEFKENMKAFRDGVAEGPIIRNLAGATVKGSPQNDTVKAFGSGVKDGPIPTALRKTGEKAGDSIANIGQAKKTATANAERASALSSKIDSAAAARDPINKAAPKFAGIKKLIDKGNDRGKQVGAKLETASKKNMADRASSSNKAVAGSIGKPGFDKAMNKHAVNLRLNKIQGGATKALKYAADNAGTLAAIGATTAAVATAGYLIYKRFFSKAAKACKGKSGEERKECIKNFKTAGIKVTISRLEKEKQQKVKMANDPAKKQKIARNYDKQISEWKSKVAKM